MTSVSPVKRVDFITKICGHRDLWQMHLLQFYFACIQILPGYWTLPPDKNCCCNHKDLFCFHFRTHFTLWSYTTPSFQNIPSVFALLYLYTIMIYSLQSSLTQKRTGFLLILIPLKISPSCCLREVFLATVFCCPCVLISQLSLHLDSCKAALWSFMLLKGQTKSSKQHNF